MEEFGANGFPDNLNEWSKQNFDEVRKMFENTVNRNERILLGKNNTPPADKPVELPHTNRDKVIQKDDILNLQIMLGQIQTVDDLIKNM